MCIGNALTVDVTDFYILPKYVILTCIMKTIYVYIIISFETNT